MARSARSTRAPRGSSAKNKCQPTSRSDGETRVVPGDTHGVRVSQGAAALPLGLVLLQWISGCPVAPTTGAGAAGAAGARHLDPPYPLPKDPVAANAGANIQRTMTLLERGGFHGRPVRVLFYGQSNTRSAWTVDVTDSLRRRFPHTTIVAENRAIGGFVAHELIRTAEHDVYHFAPDLIILHDMFERAEDFDALIAAFRTRTTADIIIQTTHVRDNDPRWDDTCRDTYAEIARKYGAELVDVRTSWKAYLTEYRLDKRAMLKGDGHLNGAGDALMSALIDRHLRFTTPTTDDRLTYLDDVGDDVPFTGTRVEAVVRGAGTLEVLVDGKKPSSFVGAWRVTRPNEEPNVEWPWEVATPRLVRTGGAPVAETWTATLNAIDPTFTRFTFKVRGSVTGDDGEGTSDKDFVSHSGRVRIEAQDWFLAQAHKLKGRRFADGTKVTWRVEPMHADIVEIVEVVEVVESANVANVANVAPIVTEDKPPGLSRRIVLVSGLENAPHRLTLKRSGDVRVALEIHKP